MKGLTFIRHAETDLAGTFCGHTDPALNALGRAHVSELIARLEPAAFDVIYSSDLRRAVETATSLAEAWSVPCITTSALREIYFGNWEALTWTQIEQADPDYARRWAERFPELPAPQGELFSSFNLRVLAEVDRLILASSSKRVAVVSHGGVMRLVLEKFLGSTQEEAWELTRPYCSSFALTASYLPREVSR